MARKLLRLFFPSAGWYVFYQQDFSPTERFGPFDKEDAEDMVPDGRHVFNVWIRFRLW